MKVLLLCCGLLLSVTTQAQIQVFSIRVLVLNARNGKAVTKTKLTMTETPLQPYATPLDLVTDPTGHASLLVQSDSDIHTLVQGHASCRAVAKADRRKPPAGYSTPQILAHGLVGENNCSKRTATPAPGELILFVRPQHWWERMSY